MPVVDLAIGPLEYRVVGPPPQPGRPAVVFVHGFLVSSTLWDSVADLLAGQGITCVLPEWPLGSHRRPASAGADLSPTNLGRVIVELLEALDLDPVVLVGNDTGGALCQLALRHDRSRVSAVVLTNCDTFEVFPPRFFLPLFLAARQRTSVWLLLQQTRLRLVRHSPLGFGRLLRRPRSAALTRSWVQPALQDKAIRADIVRFAKALERTELVGAASWLGEFPGPVRIVWGTADRCFTLDNARRLAAAFPAADLIEVDNATTFVSIDRPAAVADAIGEVVAELDARPSAARLGRGPAQGQIGGAPAAEAGVEVGIGAEVEAEVGAEAAANSA